MDADLARRIWEWLPARRSKRRITITAVTAAALDRPVAEVNATVYAMIAARHIVRDARGMMHRGFPLPSSTIPDPGLWEPPC